MDGTTATIIAAVATAASALAIAWQSVETRKSADAAGRAATASEAALQVANESLTINRSQTRLSQFTALEAMRARLAERAPSVSMSILDGPIGYAIGKSSSEDEYQLINLGTTIQVPQQQSQWLYVVYRIWFTNHGAEPVTITSYPKFFRQATEEILHKGEQDIVLAPGEHDVVLILIGSSVEAWVYKTEHHRGGVIGEGGWSSSPATSQGVVLSQEIKIIGPIIEPVGIGDWKLKGVGEDINYGSRLEIRKIDHLFYSHDQRLLPDIDPEEIQTSTP